MSDVRVSERAKKPSSRYEQYATVLKEKKKANTEEKTRRVVVPLLKTSAPSPVAVVPKEVEPIISAPPVETPEKKRKRKPTAKMAEITVASSTPTSSAASTSSAPTVHVKPAVSTTNELVKLRAELALTNKTIREQAAKIFEMEKSEREMKASQAKLEKDRQQFEEEKAAFSGWIEKGVELCKKAKV